MNSKRAGACFLLLMLVHYTVIIGMSVYYIGNPWAEGIGIVENLILSQMMNVLPVLLVILIGYGKQRRERLFGDRRSVSGEHAGAPVFGGRRETFIKEIHDILGFRKIKPTTALMAVLYTFLLMPLSTLANAVSMIFVDNTVASLTGDILEVPFFVMFLIMAVFGPLCEEAVFRGAFYRGFRKSGNLFGAVIVSALIFGLMHMNLNQAAYAILLGVMLALMAEAAGSTTASFIVHLVFNGQSVCLMYLEDMFFPELLEEELESGAFTAEEMTLVISVYLFLTVVCTAIAFCVLTWIAGNEGKRNFLRTIWESRKIRREKLWSAGLILGVVLAVLYIIFDTLAAYLLPYIMGMIQN